MRARTSVAKTQEESGEDDPAAAFDDPRSEFSGLVRLWRSYRKARQGPRRELKGWCKERQLSLLRLSEWEDVYSQVADRAAELRIVPQARAASYAAVHRSLLAGFCTNVGVRGEEGEYLGTRGVRFHIFPGSPLRRRKPRWVMAAYIVETSRVYARRVAEIEPSWVEAAARHLLKREYLEPDWDETREQVIARERITFLGLTLSANRIVNYGPIAPEESRLIFAREALVHGRLGRRPGVAFGQRRGIARRGAARGAAARARSGATRRAFRGALCAVVAATSLERRGSRAPDAPFERIAAAGFDADAGANICARPGVRAARAIPEERRSRRPVDTGGLSLCAGRGGRRCHVARAAARAADADASRGGCGDSGTHRAARERVAALLAEGGAARSDSHRRGGAGVSRRGSSTGRCAGGAILDHACARRAGEPGAVRSHAGAARISSPASCGDIAAIASSSAGADLGELRRRFALEARTRAR